MTKEEKHLGNMVRQAIEDSGCTLSEVARNVGISSTSEKIKDFDKRGVRIFITYQSSNGKFGVECYRKKTVQESTGNGDWRMIRVGLINSFDTRELAEQEALLLAEDICKQFKF